MTTIDCTYIADPAEAFALARDGRPAGNIALGRRFRTAEMSLPAVRINRTLRALKAYRVAQARLGTRQLSAFGEVG